MKIVNLTPHPVRMVFYVYHHGTGTYRPQHKTLHPHGPPARVLDHFETQTTTVETPHGRLKVTRYDYHTKDLPPEEPDTLLVVSRMVVEANPKRRDLVAPHRVSQDSYGTFCWEVRQP